MSIHSAISLWSLEVIFFWISVLRFQKIVYIMYLETTIEEKKFVKFLGNLENII